MTSRLISVDFDPFRGRFEDFRKSDNIEDRRKEHFMSFPQAPQKPNVFADGLMIELDPETDFYPHRTISPLGAKLGAGELEQKIQDYLSARAPGKPSALVPVDHDPFASMARRPVMPAATLKDGAE